MSPSHYVMSVRVDAAMRLLHAGLPVTSTAERVGLGSEALRRAFLSRVGVTPQAYQQRF